MRLIRDMDGGGIVSSLELEPTAAAVVATNGRRRMARLNEEEIEKMELPVVLPDWFLERDPKKRKEFLELRTFMVGEMQQLWDYNKRLLDHYHAHGYVQVLVDDDNMWELC